MEQQDTTTTGAVVLDDKSKKTLSDYISDVVTLENHIEEALDRQLNQVKDDQIALEAVRGFHDLVKRQRDTMRALREDYGGTAGSPIKEAGTALLGKAAGLIDNIRTEGNSKALRDDYTAFNLAAISYTMLHTTATALGDNRVAGIALDHLRGYAGAIMQINNVIPDVVVAELAKDDHKVVAGAAKTTRDAIDKTWRESAQAENTKQTLAG
jgi:ferritin-like metal-binding protein YciE